MTIAITSKKRLAEILGTCNLKSVMEGLKGLGQKKGCPKCNPMIAAPCRESLEPPFTHTRRNIALISNGYRYGTNGWRYILPKLSSTFNQSPEHARTTIVLHDPAKFPGDQKHRWEVEY
jgi:hypothetical protein